MGTVVAVSVLDDGAIVPLTLSEIVIGGESDGAGDRDGALRGVDFRRDDDGPVDPDSAVVLLDKRGCDSSWSGG